MIRNPAAEVAVALQTIHGIMTGVAVDRELTDGEVAGLRDWLSSHGAWAGVAPFSDLFAMVQAAIGDRLITDDERADILAFCERWPIGKGRASDDLTEEIRLVHGFMHGIAMDGRLTDSEVTGLREWLLQRKQFLDIWPFSEISRAVDRVLEDGVISPNEREWLLRIVSAFAQRPTESQSPIRRRPTLQSISQIADDGVEIAFPGRAFCFTGTARRPRKELESSVVARGGNVAKSVSHKLDFLVIGAQSSHCWTYATYGRKVEQVMRLRREGKPVAIVLEERFADACTFG